MNELSTLIYIIVCALLAAYSWRAVIKDKKK